MTQEPLREIPLHGGNVSTVSRLGDTVRRNTGPWTPAVHALLNHLQWVGFTGSPHVLGVDERGREVLSYLDGECGLYVLLPRRRHFGLQHAGAWRRGPRRQKQ